MFLKNKTVVGKYWWMIVALVHFIASFIYTRTVFIKDYTGLDLTVLDDSITSDHEHLLSVITARIIAFALMCAFWYFIKLLCDKHFSKQFVIAFAIILVYGVIQVSVGYPQMIWEQGDSLITYHFAVRNMPFYWHSAWTSSVMAAELMVLPHPIAILMVQMIAFAGTLAYIFDSLGQLCTRSWVKWLTIILLLYPDTIRVMMSPYRNSTYTVLALWLVAYILFNILRNNLRFSVAGGFCFVFLLAFLAVWRSEGIVLAVGLFLVIFGVAGRKDIKTFFVWCLMFICAFKLISYPQNLGNDKYYKNDYLIINTTPTLKTIFNDVDANLSYEGADEDVAAIDAICEHEYLAAEGMMGYRTSNYLRGNNMNQTCASDEERSAYMKAFANLVLHNPMDYIKTQANYYLFAMGVHMSFPIDEYTGDGVELCAEAYDNYFTLAENSKAALYSWGNTQKFVDSSFRAGLEVIVNTVNELVNKIWIKTHLYVLVKVFTFIYLIVNAIRMFVSWIRMKRSVDLILAGVTIVLFGAMVMIALLAPGGGPEYYYPILYLMYLLVFVEVGIAVKDRK